MSPQPAGVHPGQASSGRLEELPPPPALPLRPAPPAPSSASRAAPAPGGERRTARLEPPAWTALRASAAQAGIRAEVALLAGYAEVLARWGAGSQFTLATLVTAWPPEHSGAGDDLSSLADVLPVQIDRDAEITFQARAQALQGKLDRDAAHGRRLGSDALRELAQRQPSPDDPLAFAFCAAIDAARPQAASPAHAGAALPAAQAQLTRRLPGACVSAVCADQRGGLEISVRAAPGIFPEGLIADLTAAYEILLGRLATPGAFGETEFDLLPQRQRDRRAAANATAVPVPERLLPEAFWARVAAEPDAPAVLTAGATFSYRELADRAVAAASWLARHRAGRGELVALIMRRGAEQIIGILATMMAGAAYLPVDAALPAGRIAYLLRDGQVRCVLTNAGWPPRGGQESGIEVLALDAASPAGAVSTRGAAPPGARPDQPAPAGASPDDLAYVLYTSGTTGTPKGVMVSHRSIANVVTDCVRRFGVTPADRFFQISLFNFDLSVFDVFGALSTGAAIVVPGPADATDPPGWLDLCGQHGVSIWNSVPAIAGLLHDQARRDGTEALRELRLIMLSGDRIPPELPGMLRAARPGLSVAALGGPTECTVWNMYYLVDEDDDPALPVPYGKPNSNNRAYVLDAAGLDAPDWVLGEICAAGTGLARGYWRDEARTADRFFRDERRGERLYRTGDLGRYLPDGTIEITGRTDFQIKINGYRVEAGEVETRLTMIDAIKHAAVTRYRAPGGDRLIAHLVAAGADRPDDDEIRAALHDYLPAYMTPAVYLWHDKLPLTRNGKLDRNALGALSPDTGSRPGAAGPAGSRIAGSATGGARPAAGTVIH